MSSPYAPGYGQPPIYTSPKVNFGWIGESWEVYRANWVSWLILYLSSGAVCIAIFLICGAFLPGGFTSSKPGTNTDDSPSELVMQLGMNAVQFLVLICSADLALRQVKGEIVSSGDVFRGLNRFWPMLLFGLLFGVALLTGFTALCIGIYFAFGLLLPGYALVADGYSPITAFSKSIDSMKGDWLNAALFCFVFSMINWFGTVLTCGIGGMALNPMMIILSALAYRDMIGIPLPNGNSQPWTQGFPQQQTGVWPPPPASVQPPLQQRPFNQPPFGQQPGQYGQQPGQYGQAPGLYRHPPLDQQSEQFGQTPDRPADPPAKDF